MIKNCQIGLAITWLHCQPKTRQISVIFSFVSWRTLIAQSSVAANRAATTHISGLHKYCVNICRHKWCVSDCI